MNFPQFWAKDSGTVKKGWRGTQHFDCWGWSETSLADAQASARATAQRIRQFLEQGKEPLHRYAYGDRPLREQVVRKLTDRAGEVTGAITRNQYGCLVLNTARIMFVDIDLPELETGGSFLAGLFGKKSSSDSHVTTALSRVEEWTARNPSFAWRAYRTRAGLRLLATHSLFDPKGVDTVFHELGADPLYRKLCSNQKSFRARLTPKPWRLKLKRVPAVWPWESPHAEAAFQKWDQNYIAKSSERATCQFLKTIGRSAIIPEIDPIVEIHDQLTRADSRFELA